MLPHPTKPAAAAPSIAGILRLPKSTVSLGFTSILPVQPTQEFLVGAKLRLDRAVGGVRGGWWGGVVGGGGELRSGRAGGGRPGSARANAALREPLRRLPQITSTSKAPSAIIYPLPLTLRMKPAKPASCCVTNLIVV